MSVLSVLFVFFIVFDSFGFVRSFLGVFHSFHLRCIYVVFYSVTF